MTSNEEKKPLEDKKYAQLSRESLRVYAESSSGSHADLSDSVLAVLAEDANYRLREAVQNSGQFMRHARRRKLISEDVNKALHWSDVEPLYGYNNPEPLSMVYVKDAEVFCVEETELNLMTIATATSTFEVVSQPYVQAQWLAIEGVVKNGPTSASAIQVKKNGQVSTVVADDLKVYYDQVTKVILGNNEKLLRLALNDLSTNSKIAPLLPYLVNFVSVGVKKMSHDLTQLTKLLQTVSSLVNNPSLFLGLEPYLNLLVHAVLYCILEPLAASINPINDHWTLRDSAAQLLARIVKEWNSPVNNLYRITLMNLKELFTDLSKPFCAHYGAVIAIIALGMDALEEVLYPHLSQYWPHLNAALEDCSYSSAQVKADAQKVYGVLLSVAELLIRSRQKEEFILSEDDFNAPYPCEVKEFKPVNKADENDTEIKEEIKEEKNPPDSDTVKAPKKESTHRMYVELYEYFGDALAARLPYIQVTGLYKPKEKPTVDLFLAPELLQTGEELLEVFYERDEELKSNSMEDDNSYDERDDMSPLSDEHETDPVDLQIKSTVSDPALGIKLTIKLRRNKPPEEPPPKHVKRKKLTKEMWEAEPAFEYAPLISHNRYLEFSFEGASPLPRSRLKKRVLSTDQISTDSCSLVSEINAKMKKTGKKRKVSSKVLYNQRFKSGNLMIIL